MPSRKRLTCTSYFVEVSFSVTAEPIELSREENKKFSRQFTSEIERSIKSAILEAANDKIREHVEAGRLDKGFEAKATSEC